MSDEPNQSNRDAKPADMRAERGDMAPGEGKLGLEDIVRLANKVGLDFVAAKKEAERLELLKPTMRSRIMVRLDDGKISEAKLKRLAETDAEYIDFLEKLAAARADSERLRIRYESYKNLFEARRSLLSYQKAELKLF